MSLEAHMQDALPSTDQYLNAVLPLNLEVPLRYYRITPTAGAILQICVSSLLNQLSLFVSLDAIHHKMLGRYLGNYF